MFVSDEIKNYSLFPALTDEFFDVAITFKPRWFQVNDEFPEMNLAKILPFVKIKDDERNYKIELAAEGFVRDDFKIRIDNSVLTITAKKEKVKEEYSMEDFTRVDFIRSFRLPDNLNADKTDITYDNGVLNVFLPKREIVELKPNMEIEVS